MCSNIAIARPFPLKPYPWKTLDTIDTKTQSRTVKVQFCSFDAFESCHNASTAKNVIGAPGRK